MVLGRVEEAKRGQGKVTIGGVEHPAGSPDLRPGPHPSMLMYLLDEKVRFLKFSTRGSRTGWPPRVQQYIPPPLIAAATTRRLPPVCSGIVNVPLFEDGRIIATQGYNSERGVYLDLADGLVAQIGTIPKAPSKREALLAVETVLKPYRGYIDGHSPELVLLSAGSGAGSQSGSPCQDAATEPARASWPGPVARSPPAACRWSSRATATRRPRSGSRPRCCGAPVILLDNLQRRRFALRQAGRGDRHPSAPT